MLNLGKHRIGYQMSLAGLGEWEPDGFEWTGLTVFDGSGRQTKEWLSDCEESRNSTVNLMCRIADPSNLKLALNRVKSNGGSGGVDGMDIEELLEWFSANYTSLISDLRIGAYVPSPVRGVKIPKPKGGYRQLGIPTLKDRLVQQAIHQVLSPLYEGIFSDRSYGFRPNRGAHDCLFSAQAEVSKGFSYVVDIDMSKFFDEVNHDRLMSRLSQRIGDKVLLKLIHRFLRSGLMEGGLLGHKIKGTPQGGPLSPLLSNIVLDELDKELEHRGHKFVRYADDVIVLVKSEASATRVLESLTNFIEGKLKLKINRAKSQIVRSWELNFLGHSIGKDHLGLSYSSEKRLKSKLKSLTSRNRGRSLSTIISEVNRSLIGWLNYYRYARMKGKLRHLYSWLKRRLRCYRLKQCKRAIGMWRFLVSLGVPKNRSWTTATSRKGWWRISATPSAHEGMNNLWFNRIGLVHVPERYLKLHV